MFPEYTYSHDLEPIYRNYSNENSTVIIGGSGLETIGNEFYAYCPIFLPNQEIIKVYKKHITNDERILSQGQIIAFPNEVPREIRLIVGENEILFSVYVCYDFIIEAKNDRADIVFVPQYESSPQQFINEGDKVSKGMKNFVIGANNSNNNQRSLGFAILNSTMINGLSMQSYRNQNYENAGQKLDQHHTTIYDVLGERIMVFRLNIGRPYSLPFTFSLDDSEPVLIPIKNITI
ncbi:hypothetical protein [Flavobacterium commune]|uniref:CN hydrolase domain-containing protein n=1 Tax=Flavobacterium commune TaxID=1306519 RepID=A0A1D9PAB8_9FLAO|nr:hypothetical protein [Flavobacterium commune]AOZ99519.1 hypothetical protein BIW12_08725 [Flavobacterium commune]